MSPSLAFQACLPHRHQHQRNHNPRVYFYVTSSIWVPPSLKTFCTTPVYPYQGPHIKTKQLILSSGSSGRLFITQSPDHIYLSLFSVYSKAALFSSVDCCIQNFWEFQVPVIKADLSVQTVVHLITASGRQGYEYDRIVSGCLFWSTTFSSWVTTWLRSQFRRTTFLLTNTTQNRADSVLQGWISPSCRRSQTNSDLMNAATRSLSFHHHVDLVV